MKRLLAVGLGLTASLTLSGCMHGDWGMSHRATVEESRPLAMDGRFSLENTNGRVEVTAWDEARVAIEATKHAHSERALEELQIEIVGEGDSLRVRSRYPHPRWLGGGGRVDYHVRVPRTARVSVENVNGRVEIERVAAPVEASTVNGSVEVTLASVDPAGRNRIHTTNGSVRLTLPSDAGAEVEARTVNGSVSCDFDLAGPSKTRRKLEGRIGAGGGRFDLATVNGSVTIDRGRSARVEAKPPAEATPKPSR